MINVSEILKQGFEPEEVEVGEGDRKEKYLIYGLEIEHPFFSGLHLSIDPKHNILSVYLQDLDYNSHFRIYETFANEINIAETIKFFTYQKE